MLIEIAILFDVKRLHSIIQNASGVISEAFLFIKIDAFFKKNTVIRKWINIGKFS